MIRVAARVVLALAALATPLCSLASQAIRGRTEHTVCPSPFRPISGLTFHEGKAWSVTYHTFPYQYGFAQYSAVPSPAISDDGQAMWTNPGVYVECTNTWYLNPNGSIAYVDFRWHIISYRGQVTVNNDGCESGGGGDPIYMTSYDPYAPDENAVDASVQSYCGGDGGGGGGGGGTGGGVSCRWEWMEIEISYNGGLTWETYWSGWGQTCESLAT
jgi:hypothetical protein